MPEVFSTLTKPGGAAKANEVIRVRLLASSNGEAEGFVSSAQSIILDEYSTLTDANGRWSFTLTANSLITPANSTYQVIQPGIGGTRVTETFIVPNGAGPYWLGDILAEAPVGLPGLALDAHDASLTAHAGMFAPLIENATVSATEQLKMLEGTTFILASAVPAANVREQDAILEDPTETDPARRWKFYFTAASNIAVMFSPDGVTWSAPTVCQLQPSFRQSQDPTVVRHLNDAKTIYRDGAGNMHMYVEDSTTMDIYVYRSSNGTHWDRAPFTNPAVTRGAAGSWESDLVGSPNARWDGSNFIVLYEGRSEQGTAISGNDSTGVAHGASPDGLTKLAANPVWTAAADPHGFHSVIIDDFWREGAKFRFLVHSGVSDGNHGWMAETSKLDPLTWVEGDIRSISDNLLDAGSSDLTRDYSTDNVVLAYTATNDRINKHSLVTLGYFGDHLVDPRAHQTSTVFVPRENAEIWVPPQSFIAVQGTPVLQSLSSSSWYQGWLMDADVREGVAAQVKIPSWWNAYRFALYCVNAGVGVGAVRWRIQRTHATRGQALPAVVTIATLDVTALGQNVVQVTDFGIQNPQAANPEIAMINITRDGGNAADTLPNDSAFLGLLLTRTS